MAAITEIKSGLLNINFQPLHSCGTKAPFRDRGWRRFKTLCLGTHFGWSRRNRGIESQFRLCSAVLRPSAALVISFELLGDLITPIGLDGQVAFIAERRGSGDKRSVRIS